MKKSLKYTLLIIVLVLTIGYAAVNTTLNLTGKISFGKDENDFDIRFTKALVDGIDETNLIISEDGRSITFAVDDLITADSTSTLNYLITNNSTQYDANIEVSCTAVGSNGDYFTIIKDTPGFISAQTHGSGQVTALLNETGNVAETFECILEATPVSRTSIAIEQCDSQSQIAPVLAGGGNNWTYEDVTISIVSEGSAVSGVKIYEYYITDSTDLPTSETTPTGTTNNEVILTDNGIYYVYYRTVAESGCKSAWTAAQIVMIDKTEPVLEMNSSIPSSVTRGDVYPIATKYETNGISGGTTICTSNLDGKVSTNDIGDLTTLGNHTLTCVTTTGAGKSLAKSINVTITYAPYSATNMISNGSFENGTNDWTLSGEVNLSQDYMTSTNACYTAATGNNNLKFGSGNSMTTQVLDYSAPTVNHQYYGRLLHLTSSPFTTTDARFEWRYSDVENQGTLIFGKKNNASTCWSILSSVKTVTSSTYLTQNWTVRNFYVNMSPVAYVDDLVIIDLTETFGAGNEPDKDWCDKHITFFDGTTTIYK